MRVLSLVLMILCSFNGLYAHGRGGLGELYMALGIFIFLSMLFTLIFTVYKVTSKDRKRCKSCKSLIGNFRFCGHCNVDNYNPNSKVLGLVQYVVGIVCMFYGSIGIVRLMF